MLGKVATGATPLASTEFIVYAALVVPDWKELLVYGAVLGGVSSTLEETLEAIEGWTLDLGVSSPPQEASKRDAAKANTILWETLITTSLD